jgi:hypothetical protein
MARRGRLLGACNFDFVPIVSGDPFPWVWSRLFRLQCQGRSVGSNSPREGLEYVNADEEVLILKIWRRNHDFFGPLSGQTAALQTPRKTKKFFGYFFSEK